MPCSAGDVERLFTEHYGWLCRLSVRMLRDRGLAEQVVMDVFVELHSRRATIESATAAAYLKQAVVHRTQTVLTRATTETRVVDRATREGYLPGSEAGGVDRLHGVADRRDMLRALDRLPAQQKIATVLRYYGDLPEAEIAEVMSVSIGTVKSYLSRARDKLQADLAGRGSLA